MINKYPFTYHSECIIRLPEKKSLKSKLGSSILEIRKYVSQKTSLNVFFFQTIYGYFILNIFSDKIVAYYRNIDGSPNLICQFQVLEVILSMKNGSKNFLVVHYRKTDVCRNLVTLCLRSACIEKTVQTIFLNAMHKLLFKCLYKCISRSQ